MKSCPESRFIEITRDQNMIFLEIKHQIANVICEYFIYNPKGFELKLTLFGISEHYFQNNNDHALWIYGKYPEEFDSIISSSDKSLLKKINPQ